jgi:hypothetical protein
MEGDYLAFSSLRFAISRGGFSGFDLMGIIRDQLLPQMEQTDLGILFGYRGKPGAPVIPLSSRLHLP